MTFLLIPVDNRPITFQFPQIVCKVAGLKTILPPVELMGSLCPPQGTQNNLSEWLSEKIRTEQIDYLIFSLDSFVYGGLINSRRGEESEQELSNRLKEISKWKKITTNPMHVFCQSSILRISDNYDNTEEKSYWSRYGREIFQWSELLHKNISGLKIPEGTLESLESKIDPSIRADYLSTRKRNFKINTKLLDLVSTGDIDFLILSQDDSGEFGLNVLEQEKLLKLSTKMGISRKVMSYPGSDETLQTLITLSLLEKNTAKSRPQISLEYSSPYGFRINSRYEGQNIGQTVEKQIQASGLSICNESNSKIDFQVLIHCHENIQGDHIFLPGHPDLRSLNSSESVNKCLDIIARSTVPIALCDVAYANGADPLLISELFKRPDLMKKLWAYSGWNTTGNTIGSAIALATARWYSEIQGHTILKERAFQEAMFIRLADDWAYQTQIRPQLSGQVVSDTKLAELMRPNLSEIANKFGFTITSAKVSFPWQRTFEIEINITN